jgi:uncharacterized protein (TIGR03435 family)
MTSVAAAILWATLCFGQPAPRFEVASIKPDKSDDRGGDMRPIAGGFSARNLSVGMFIQSAYNLKAWEILGGPDWLTTDRYDIEAKTEGNPSSQEKLDMLRPLLADRFQLKFHRETRQMPMYSLTAAKSGPKLQATPSGARGYIRPGRGLIEGRGVSMSTLANFLGGSLIQSVTDNTGIGGSFDIRLEWTPTEGESHYSYDDRPVDSNGPSIFTAIQEQLGLKLEGSKGPIEVLVIDHVERPSEN